MKIELPATIIIVNTSRGSYDSSALNEGDLADPNLRIQQEDLQLYNDGDVEIFIVSTNKARNELDVHRILVEPDEDKSTEDEDVLKIADFELI